MSVTRDRRDRCPGALRPWLATDGLLVRLRLIGGRLPIAALRSLLTVAEQFGDGRIHLTGRANLQLRALPGADGHLDGNALAAIEATGLLPSPTHELIRNIMVSPGSGIAGGRADLRGAAADLDERLRAEPSLAALPGRFLFVLDDGRGDLLGRGCDLGIVALDERRGQLRVGAGFGDVIDLDDAASTLAGLAVRFNRVRGDTPEAPWHVDELTTPLVARCEADARMPKPTAALPWGAVPGGMHFAVPASGMHRPDVEDIVERARRSGTDEVIVTPWRGVLVPDLSDIHPPTNHSERPR